MREKGIVREIKGGQAVIEVVPQKECTKCCSCSASVPRNISVDAGALDGAAEGDSVYVEIVTGPMMRVYLLLYGLPLAVFVGTMGLAYYLSRSPIVSFTAALFAMIAVYLFIGRLFRTFPALTPEVKITRI